MSLLYSVITATRCRSTHHRLALEGLRFLKGADAARWRALLLHHHDQYLKGAKAPDAVFKDFKNHVLHVRSGEWGGAIEAAEEWRKRTIRAMQDKDWSHVAWCAGVMSHYVVDPFQPFHTHQTEEENVIHRAVEWSFYKSYALFQTIIDRELGGYPEITLPSGPDWLAQTIRNAAHLSTAQYETIVDHYNFAVGAKRPVDGLDQELRSAIAPLVARAAVTWGLILDRLAEEAQVRPPMVHGGLQAFFLTLEAPIQNVLKLISDSQERAFVAAQYEEFRKTGKVRSTLSDDDSTVRALHAAEVLKAPLSSLDARWPREIGTAHKPSKKRFAKKRKGAAAKAAPAAAAQPVRAAAPRVEAPPPVAAAPPPAPPPAPVRAEAPQQPAASPFFSPSAAPPRAPEPAPAPPKGKARAAPPPEPLLGPPPVVVSPPAPPPLLLTKKIKKKGKDVEISEYTLRGESPIVDAPSIGPKTAKRFQAIGIRSVSDLLALSPATAAVLLNTRHISSVDISDWQAEAVLACTLVNLKSKEAQALVACGVRDAETIAGADVRALAEGLRAWAATGEGQRSWGGDAPTEEDARSLIERAKAALAPMSAA